MGGRSAKRLIAALLAAVTALALLPASVSAAGDAGFYRASGTQILDGDGDPVVMKGISFGNAHYGNIYTSVELDQYGHGVLNDHDAASFLEVAEMGLDHVRFEFNYGLFEDDDKVGVYKQSGFDWIDQNIAWAKAAGIRLILQMKTPQGGYQNATDAMYGEDDGGKALWIDIDQQTGAVLDTENYNKNQERLVNLWQAIAERYKDEPTIIGYGLLNEPAVPQRETAAATVGQWKDLAQRIADAIRRVDKNHILFVERLCSYFDPTGYDKTDWDLVSTADSQFLIDDDNTVYEFHFYEPLEYTHQGADWLTDTYGDCRYDGLSVAEAEIDWDIGAVASWDSAQKGTDGDWTYFESRPFTKGDGYNIAQPRVSMGGVPGGGSVWVDDLKITEISDGAETTVLAYDFSDDLGGFFKVWNGGDDFGAVALDPSVGHNAPGAMKLTNSPSSPANEWANAQSWDSVALEDGCTYKISGYIKGGDGSCRPKADFYQAKIWRMDKDYLEHKLEEYTAFGAENNVPMHVGEWGFHYNCYDKGAEQYTKDLTELFAKYGLSSNYHSYHDATFALYLSQEFEARPERNETLYGYLTRYYCHPAGPCGGADCLSRDYTDVDRSAWYHEGVDYAIANGLMTGKAGGVFDPGGVTTRAEMVTILYNLEGRPAVAGDAPFSDVPPGQWYSDAVSWAYASGVVDGCGDGKFGPGDPITRQQMAAILYSYAAFKGYDVSAAAQLSGYADAGSVSHWAGAAMGWAVGKGLIKGMSGAVLAPAATATRAQTATILMLFREGAAK